MARKYKIVKVAEREFEFMKKYKVSACTYCSYCEGYIGCNFNGKCPAGVGEYLEKINKLNTKKR